MFCRKLTETQTDPTELDSTKAPWRNWYWWLPYVGGLVAVVVLVGTILTLLFRSLAMFTDG